MNEFWNDDLIFVILKYNNVCGIVIWLMLVEVYFVVFVGDFVFVFGGILIVNWLVDVVIVELMNDLFCEVVIVFGFDDVVLELLKLKKNCILFV